jgi:hypothetical protein
MTASMTYYEGELDSDNYVVVPKGAITDLTSIPRIFRATFDVWGDHGPAAITHDQLYTDKAMFIKGAFTPITRARADAIFLEAMEVLGVPRWKRYTMYAGVRAGGWMAWRDKD